jgi:xanthine dehydrogenase small subunit
MRGTVATLTLLRPRTLREALDVLRDDPELVPLAGATDLYVSLNFGTLEGTRFLDLWPLRPLRRITEKGDVLSIGALATYSAMIRSRAVRSRVPMLAAASGEVGGAQIQNRGTLGGNIANASPAADTLPVLAATDAMVVLSSRAGERRVPITRFYTGYRATVRRSDELITAVEIPRVEGEQYFRKVGTRAAQAIAKVVMAAVRGPLPRVALGSVAPTVVRLPRTEEVLAQGAGLDDAVSVLQSEIHPIDDVRSTEQYRRRVAGNLLRECFAARPP